MIVTADQVAKLPDGRIVIAKPPTCECRSCLYGNREHPPDDLVAITEPCQTCRGTGWDYVVPEMARKLAAVPRCPDCHAGHPLFDLKVRCDHLMVAVSNRGKPTSRRRCIRCLDDGFVTHAGLYVPGPLLPVVHHVDWNDGTPCVEYDKNGNHQLWDGSGRALSITLPGISPGWYAALAERSEP